MCILYTNANYSWYLLMDYNLSQLGRKIKCRLAMQAGLSKVALVWIYLVDICQRTLQAQEDVPISRDTTYIFLTVL